MPTFYNPHDLRKTLSRLGVNADGVVDTTESKRRIRVMDALMLEKDALIRAYMNGAATGDIYRVCKEHGMVSCSPPAFYITFRQFLVNAQVPIQPKRRMIDAKRRLALKPSVAKLMVELRTVVAATKASAEAEEGSAVASSPTRSVRRRLSSKSKESPSRVEVSHIPTGGPRIPRPTAGGSVAAKVPITSRGTVDLHRERLRDDA